MNCVQWTQFLQWCWWPAFIASARPISTVNAPLVAGHLQRLQRTPTFAGARAGRERGELFEEIDELEQGMDFPVRLESRDSSPEFQFCLGVAF